MAEEALVLGNNGEVLSVSCKFFWRDSLVKLLLGGDKVQTDPGTSPDEWRREIAC